jgi:hypothetical protein
LTPAIDRYKASSTYSTSTPDKAADGSTTTMWNSGSNMATAPTPKWWYVDLGATRSISEVRVLAGTGSPTGTTYYTIQVSNDTISPPTNWTTLTTNTNGSASLYTINSNLSATARYVRILITDHKNASGVRTTSWIALLEVQAYGN